MQGCPGHAIQRDHGLAVDDLEKATSFVRTYSQVTRQVRARKQDCAVKRRHRTHPKGREGSEAYQKSSTHRADEPPG